MEELEPFILAETVRSDQYVSCVLPETETTLCHTVCTFHKHVNLKIVGKPCEGKPHARFDEGRLGRPQGHTSFLLYKENFQVAITVQVCLFFREVVLYHNLLKKKCL